MPRIPTSLQHRTPSGYTADELRHRARARQADAHRSGLLVVAYEDDRLTWPERELLRQVGERLSR